MNSGLTKPMVEPSSRAPFEQAGIPVDRVEQFEQLRSTIARVFARGAVEGFFRVLQRKRVPIRDFDRVLCEKLLERTDGTLAKSGSGAQRLYDALTVSDQ